MEISVVNIRHDIRRHKITGHEDVPVNSESALLKAATMQRVSVAIAAEYDFHSYCSVVFNGTTDDGFKYWPAKNSCGTGWGEEGYIRMQRDVEA